MFPTNFVSVILPKMNAATINKISLREYVYWLGLTVIMGCFEGISHHHQWFSKEPITVDKGAPFCLNKWMVGNQYKEIMQLHHFTNEEPSPYEDKLFEVQQMQEWWNHHYSTEYSPSYFNYLDKSMNRCLNQCCPGWMCVPCKSHPFGNE